MNPNDQKDPLNPHYNAPGSAPASTEPTTPDSAPASPMAAAATAASATAHMPMPSASNLNPELPPTYKDMLHEIGKQLNMRKSLLLKRVLFIVWPGLLLLIAMYIGNKLNDQGLLFQYASKTTLFIAGGIYVVFAVAYMLIAGFMFEIEKQIWIDSHFDKKDLEPRHSWAIAKKLFWPAFRLRLRIAWMYYLLPTLVCVAVLVGFGFWATNANVTATYASNIGIMIAILFLVFLVFAIIWSYYVKVKIRYAWFVFLDIYKGEPFDTRVVLSQMNALNTASKSASFKKALVAEIGTDSANVIANLAVGAIGFGVSRIPGVGELLGGLTRAYGQELTRQATSLGKISAMYLLYRYARKELFGSEQVSNEYVYQLIGPRTPSAKSEIK